MDWNRITDYVQRKVTALAWMAPTSRTTPSGGDKIGEADAVEGYETGEDDKKYQYRVRRIEPFGFRSMAPIGVLGLIIKVLGGASNGVLVGTSSSKYGPSDLKEGEAAMYCRATGTIVKMDQNGNITISAAGGSDVIINGGSAKVARVGDYAVAGSAMSKWMGQVEVVVNGISKGAVTPLSSTFNVLPNAGIATISTGADNVKA